MSAANYAAAVGSVHAGAIRCAHCALRDSAGDQRCTATRHAPVSRSRSNLVPGGRWRNSRMDGSSKSRFSTAQRAARSSSSGRPEPQSTCQPLSDSSIGSSRTATAAGSVLLATCSQTTTASLSMSLSLAHGARDRGAPAVGIHRSSRVATSAVSCTNVAPPHRHGPNCFRSLIRTFYDRTTACLTAYRDACPRTAGTTRGSRHGRRRSRRSG